MKVIKQNYDEDDNPTERIFSWITKKNKSGYLLSKKQSRITSTGGGKNDKQKVQ